jgi:hypothetical protein
LADDHRRRQSIFRRKRPAGDDRTAQRGEERRRDARAVDHFRSVTQRQLEGGICVQADIIEDVQRVLPAFRRVERERGADRTRRPFVITCRVERDDPIAIAIGHRTHEQRLDG